MPRIPRGLLAHRAYHVLSLGNGRAVAFHVVISILLGKRF